MLSCVLLCLRGAFERGTQLLVHLQVGGAADRLALKIKLVAPKIGQFFAGGGLLDLTLLDFLPSILKALQI